MDPAVAVPLAAFALVVLIVVVVHGARIHDLEREAARGVHAEQLDHQRKMRELNLELERVKGQSKSSSSESGS